MAYAQINYSQRLGNGPYSIADAGCFLTSFCNLLARFGESVDPPTLNQFFINDNKYTHDASEAAGTADDLYWGAVSAYDGHIIPVGVGGAGWPDSNDAIVKFIYKSPRSGLTVTHFCLVQDHSAGTIVDSWDGVIKKSPYGTPVAWAKYERHVPQPVSPPAPVEQPAFTIENIPEREEELKLDTYIWDLNQRSWPGLVNNPVGTGNMGTVFKTTQIAHHVLGGSYYLPEGSQSQGYNVVDCENPVAPITTTPTPPPQPATPSYTTNKVDGITFEALDNAPRQMWISKVGGADKWSFSNVSNWRDFKPVQHLDYGTEIFISGVAHHPIPPKGADYYMTSDDFGDFKKTGKVTNYYGFNWSDISSTKPPKIIAEAVASTPPVAAVPTPPPAPEPPKTIQTTVVPADWQAGYTPFPNPVDYITTRNIVVKDLSGKQADAPLPQGTNVKAYGTVPKDGVNYYRLRTNNDPNFDFWYCVPKIDPVTNTANLLVKPVKPLDPGEPVSKISVARDTLELVKARIEADAPKFLDDMVPKFLRNKNKK